MFRIAVGNAVMLRLQGTHADTRHREGVDPGRFYAQVLTQILNSDALFEVRGIFEGNVRHDIFLNSTIFAMLNILR